MSSLFGAVQGFAAGRPAQIDERGVGGVEGRYPDRGQRGRAIGGARRGAGGGERGREGVKRRPRVRGARRVGLEGERVAVGRREGVAVVERVSRRGLVAREVAVRALHAAAGARDPTAGRDEAPGVNARANWRRTRTGDDVDLQAAGFGAPERVVGVHRVGNRRPVVTVLQVLAQRQVQSWKRRDKT